MSNRLASIEKVNRKYRGSGAHLPATQVTGSILPVTGSVLPTTQVIGSVLPTTTVRGSVLPATRVTEVVSPTHVIGGGLRGSYVINQPSTVLRSSGPIIAPTSTLVRPAATRITGGVVGAPIVTGHQVVTAPPTVFVDRNTVPLVTTTRVESTSPAIPIQTSIVG